MHKSILIPLGVALLIVAAGCGAGQSESALTSATSEGAGSAKPVSNPAMTQYPHRDVVRKGAVRLLVPSCQSAERAAARAAEALGGYVESSSTSLEADSKPTVVMSLRIPSARFQDAVQRIESLGVVLEKSMSAEDVTGRLIDLGARIRTMKASEESLQSMLRKRSRLNEVIALEERLTQLRGTIESLQSELASQKGRATFSTLDITLEQRSPVLARAADPLWMSEAWAGATASMASAARGAFAALVWLVVWAPFWLLPILVLRFLALRGRKGAAAFAGDGSA